MLLYLGLEKLRRFPEVAVCVTLLKCGELEGVNPCVGFEGPWSPPVGVNIFCTIAVLCTTDWENAELFCSGAKSEGTRGAGVAEEKRGCETSSERGTDEGIGEWWMVLLPR